jgi:ABC-type branched-subunit amino acid transport system ATPase component
VSGPGLVAVLLFVPGGLASMLFGAWDRVVRRVTGDDAPLAAAAPAGVSVARHPLPPAVVERSGHDVPALCAESVTVHFGGNVAVDDVSLELHAGEIVGLVGPNGAGKTTLFDVLSGHLAADTGRVRLGGVDVTTWRADQRARFGLGRTFQQARLFDDLTVTETLQVALEREEPSEIVPSLLGYPPSRRAERRKERSVDHLVDLLGLGPFASLRVAELSTGTRRLVELGAVIALRTQVLLLDEPTAGIAQREVEAFAPLLREVRDHLDASIIIIEHDIPLVMALADRVYALAVGQVIAAGGPADVRNDPTVVAAYLGTDERVIARSGARA